MQEYEILKLKPEDYHKCSNIWDMEKKAGMAKAWYNQLVSGVRIIWVYTTRGEFIGEGSLVMENYDPDYTIKGQRVYFSRVIVKEEYRNQGIGGTLIDFIIEQAKLMGYREISIGVDKKNINALHLYRKKGFTEVIFDGEDEHGPYYKLVKRLGDEIRFEDA